MSIWWRARTTCFAALTFSQIFHTFSSQPFLFFEYQNHVFLEMPISKKTEESRSSATKEKHPVAQLRKKMENDPKIGKTIPKLVLDTTRKDFGHEDKDHEEADPGRSPRQPLRACGGGRSASSASPSPT